MKKFLIALISLILIFSITACENYVNSYSAIGLIRYNTKDHCGVDFMSFKGKCVFKIKKADGGEGDIHYTASLEEGDVTVYYDVYGTKEELFSIKGGESVDGRGGYVDSNKSVTVIVEATEKAKEGKVRIDFE